MKASKFEENNNSAKRYSAKSENSDKWLNLEMNKIIFCTEYLDEKYQNGNLDVHDLHRYHWFHGKMAVRCSKSNSKRGSLNWNSENPENSLNLLCSEQFLAILEPEFEHEPERKSLAKCQFYNFCFVRFQCLVAEFG